MDPPPPWRRWDGGTPPPMERADMSRADMSRAGSARPSPGPRGSDSDGGAVDAAGGGRRPGVIPLAMAGP